MRSEPIAEIWPTDGRAETWTDSRGYKFKMVNSMFIPDGWGCTVCMNDETDATIGPEELVFIDADEWPWVDHGQNHPSCIHIRHFALRNRRRGLVAPTPEKMRRAWGCC